MAVKTGVLTIGFTVPRENARIEPQPENAGETYPKGAILQMSGGVVIVAPDGDVASGYGIAYTGGQDLAVDGTAEASIWRLMPGEEYCGTLSGTLVAANLPGGASNVVKIVQTAGVPLFVVDAAGTWRVKRPAKGWALNDVNPRIYATPKDSFIQAGGGNE